MMNQQQWPQLPLFLHTLEEKGFVLLAERYEFVLHIAQRSADLEELKLRLSALLSSTPQQQRQFTECFEQFFNPIIAPFNSFLEQQEQLQEEWRHMQNILNSQIERTVQESSATKPKRSFYTLRNFLILLGFSLILLICLYYAGYGLEAYVGILALLVSFVLIAEGYLSLRKPERPFTLRREAIAPPSSFFDIHIPAYAEVRFGRAFQGIARRLRQRLPTDQPVLDVPATIRKSITHGGFFTPQYLYRSKAPAYLLLIDQSSVANHRFQLAELLHNWLIKQDIEVERFWYRNDPRTCWNEAHPSGIPLEQLPQRYAESQLLLFGDGWQLLNPASQKLQAWARAFAQWENRTLVTPIAPPAWTRKETQLAQLFILAPASVEGLRYWSESMLPQTEQNSPKAPVWQEKAVLITKDNFLPALHRHFPDERLREWLCALACFPVLNWELTLRIGAVLSQKHGTYLLDYANLRRLTRLSWFYNGYVPEEIRELLYQQLDPTVAQLIHQCIVQILAEQVEDGRQHFSLNQRELVLQIAVQQVAAGMAQAKDLIKYVWSNISSTGNQDFLVLKHFNSTPYDIKVPYDLVKLLQRNQEYFFKSLMRLNMDAYHSLILFKKISAFFTPYFLTKRTSIFQTENFEPTSKRTEKIRTLIAQGELDSALQILSEIQPNNPDVLLLNRILIELNNSYRKGMISKAVFDVRSGEIAHDILNVIKLLALNEMESKSMPVATPQDEQVIFNEGIKNLIVEGDLKSALQILSDIKPINKEVILLNARLTALTRDFIRRVITMEDYNHREREIINDILYLVDSMPPTKMPSKILPPEVPQEKKVISKQGIKNLIAKGKLKSAIQILSDISPTNQNILFIEASLNQLNKDSLIGMITIEEFRRREIEIINNVLILIDSMDSNQMTSKPISVEIPQEKQPVSEQENKGFIAERELSSKEIQLKPKSVGKKIFISYSKKDYSYLEELNTHLLPLKRNGKITASYDREHFPGEEWDENIMTELKTADIFLLLVSPDFINTEYTWGKEITLAMERHEKKEARVIPVIIRNCQWYTMPFSKLNVLPAKGKPVKSYDDRDEAWLEVVKGIERVLEK